MKKYFILFILSLPLLSLAQQNLPGGLNHALIQTKTNYKTLFEDGTEKVIEKVKVEPKLKLPVFGLIGASNLNEEAFKKLNASGKVSMFFRPYKSTDKSLTIYTSYNVNASNGDSALYGTLIFPEVGKNSFLGTVEFRRYWLNQVENGLNSHSLAPYFEFSHKAIKSDTSNKSPELSFATLNYTLGLKYIFNIFRLSKDEKPKETDASFFVSLYLSSLNIPDEDIDDYQAILSKGKTFNPAQLTDDFRSVGIKIGAQINSFGVFADFRHVLGNDNKIPLKELRGFHSNIGFTLNTDIFNLY
jgi:hypothetical protein